MDTKCPICNSPSVSINEEEDSLYCQECCNEFYLSVVLDEMELNDD